VTATGPATVQGRNARRGGTSRSPVPLTDQQYAERCDCRCADGPDVHPAGQCALLRAHRAASKT
jgi:hypothetical protein